MKINQIKTTNINIKPLFINKKQINLHTNLIKSDLVSFSSNYATKPLEVDWQTAKFVASSLTTSTAGHRAPYKSKTFNKEIITMLTLGVADYAKEVTENEIPKVLIGGDARLATKEMLPIIAQTLARQEVDVLYIDKPIPTPALSFIAKEYKADATILMTASHNPWADGGFNIITQDGAIAPANITKKVAMYALEYAKKGYYKEQKTSKVENIHKFYPYETYKKLLDSHQIINWEKLKDSNITIYYDGLKGSGCNVLPKLLKENKIDCREIESTGQIGPNPTKENLKELSLRVKNSQNPLTVGFSNDGDADRFGVIDENGNFVSTNDVLLLATYHLIKNKNMDGIVLRSHSTSSQLDEIAKWYNKSIVVTPVGFKYIGEKILDLRNQNKDILIAGEESGGLTINSHVPEKDGILANLIIADLIASENKPLSQILGEIKSQLSATYLTKSINIKLEDNQKKDQIIQKAQEIYDKALLGDIKFGDFEIDAVKTKKHQENIEQFKKSGDGIKLFFTDGSSLLIRKSGTEPLIRYYIEALDENYQKAKDEIEKIENLIQETFNKTK